MKETTVRRICVACWQLWPILVWWGGAFVALIAIERVSAPPFRWDGLILGAAIFKI